MKHIVSRKLQYITLQHLMNERILKFIQNWHVVATCTFVLLTKQFSCLQLQWSQVNHHHAPIELSITLLCTCMRICFLKVCTYIIETVVMRTIRSIKPWLILNTYKCAQTKKTYSFYVYFIDNCFTDFKGVLSDFQNTILFSNLW